jgi:AcrR family transcriptional regulator
MTTRSNSSRERILASAEAIVLQKGFNATSIEDILKQASITKGGFFYHFDGKPGLAKALIERYIEQDDQIFSDLFAEANELSEDPLHQLLIFLKLLAGKLGAMEDTHPGCLVASFIYESQQFKPEIRELMRDGMLSWRNLIADQLQRINEKYAVPDDVSIETLADMFTSTIEGGIILTRNFGDNQLLVNQILAYRSFLRRLYE